MSVTYQLGISSADAVTLYPDYDYFGGQKQIRSEHRSRSGKLRVYKWGDYDRFKFGLNWVPASDASLVNSWWDTNTKLLLFITSDTATEVHSCMIMNDETPLGSYNEPYVDYYKGAITLEGY